MLQQLILINPQDEIIGFEEKLKVHQQGLLHRAFSILIFNAEGEMLLQQRAFGKYHSAGLWTNACCGHPNRGEYILQAAHRRLQEEMGFDCELTFSFKFHYQTTFENSLIENEIDHVFTGTFEGNFIVNLEEVVDYKWVDFENVKIDVLQNPQKYTYWFQKIIANYT